MNAPPWRVEVTRTAQRDLRRLDPRSASGSAAHSSPWRRIHTAAPAFDGLAAAPRRDYGSAAGGFCSRWTLKRGRSSSSARCRVDGPTATEHLSLLAAPDPNSSPNGVGSQVRLFRSAGPTRARATWRAVFARRRVRGPKGVAASVRFRQSERAGGVVAAFLLATCRRSASTGSSSLAATNFEARASFLRALQVARWVVRRFASHHPGSRDGRPPTAAPLPYDEAVIGHAFILTRVALTNGGAARTRAAADPRAARQPAVSSSWLELLGLP